ncbi:DNA polymerase II [Vibrio sp. SS-MA-C1-2]|uniref:DNA polymerase II n=1 Tax=Vibrio sp. SS-MA-C1-2 TaxID=2908646 RepID=UPI001F3A3F70|nr:DNA polymerase II [Vibrio sp. SS-MA-C1-2]UJF17774.1 DNA polymerase II [Vibrio sp. SS-MA-C1-2]
MPHQHHGFVLTRHSRDRGDHHELVLWVKTDNQPHQLIINDQRPLCFIHQEDLNRITALDIDVDTSPLKLKTFNHQKIAVCYFKTHQKFNYALKLFDTLNIPYFEADIRLTDRFMMERFIRGGITFNGQYQKKQGYTAVYQAQAKAVEQPYHPNLLMVSLDLECSEKGVLYSVGLASNVDNRVIMVGDKALHPDYSPSEFTIEWVIDEKALLIRLEQWFHHFDPDVIIGWNVVDFDFRLLLKRAAWHGLTFKIGRGSEKPYFREGSHRGYISIAGRVVLDGIDTLKNASYHFASWSLESVSQELLNKGKAIDNPHDRMAEINRKFQQDKPSLAYYNFQDCRLVEEIFAKTDLLAFAIERVNLTGLELDKNGGSVAAFTHLYLPQLHRAGYVAPNLESENWIASPGGYVMESMPGLYDSVLVLDFKSLYPAIIRSFCIDPMGLIEGLQLQEQQGEQADVVTGYRGGVFHRTKHFLPAMIEKLWAARDVAKKENNSAFSHAIKIIMNSFYGVLGSSGCRFFDHRLASSITMRGHEIMKVTKALIEDKGYQVIYGDTDSTFVWLKSAKTPEQANKIGCELANYINHWWQKHLQQNYQRESALEIEYETHYHKFFMPTIRNQEQGSKKRYAGLIWQNGVEKAVFKGLETVRTDWTALAKTFQKELYDQIFHDKPVDEYIRRFVNDTKQGIYDQQLIYRKRLRRKLSEYQKNVPPQVRAARLADEFNAKLGRQLQYQNHGVIEYVLTINGVEPKEYQQSQIDYQHYIDKQLKPVADSILVFLDKSFDEIISDQITLF